MTGRREDDDTNCIGQFIGSMDGDELTLLDGLAELDKRESAALDAAIARSLAEAATGQVADSEQIIAKLRARRR